MIGKELIGRESEPIVLKIRLNEVRRFAEVIGVRFDDRVPATFVGTLILANIPGVELPIPGLIHGEQKITYYRPLNVGDSLTCKKKIKMSMNVSVNWEQRCLWWSKPLVMI